MVRMKLSKEEFDPKALDVKVEKSTFKRYRGEIPRNGTILIFRVTRMWWTQSKAGDSQIYLMAFAEQNKGQLKQYNGLPVREYLTFNPDAAFRYQNFLQNFGLTTRDIFNKMDVEREPDNIGDIINSIADWVVGSDDALCRIALVRDRYDPDELKAKVDKDGWLPLDENDELDDDIDDDEDEEDEEEDEEDKEPAARPTTRARGRSSQGGRQAKPAARRRAEPEPEDDEDDEDLNEDDDDETEDIEDDAEEEEQEGEADEEEEPPAQTRARSRNTGRATTRTRPAAARSSDNTRRSTSASPRDGSRTRTSSARTDRTVGPKGSKGRDGGSREDPPF